MTPTEKLILENQIVIMKALVENNQISRDCLMRNIFLTRAHINESDESGSM